MLRYLVFFSVVIGIVAGVHYYLWARLVRDAQLDAPYRMWGTVALLVLAASVPLSFLVMRRLPEAWARLVAWPVYSWMGLMFLLFVLVLAADVVRLIVHLGARLSGPGPLDSHRRLMVARALAGGVGAGGLLVGSLALRKGVAAPVVENLEIELNDLPAEADGTTIVQLTDMHVGPTIGRTFVEDIVRRTNALAPDVVAITGDLVDGSVTRLRDAVAPLAELRARHGIYFVTGNHEYFSGADAWIEELGRLGMRVLRNQRVALPGFDIAGIDDHGAGSLAPGHGPDLPRALAGREPSRPVVLLAHQPRAVVEAAALGVSLQLSGHTHGGQIWPFSYMVKLQQPYIAGLHRHGGTQIYVSPGTGYWGPPMRLGTRAEITRITLRRARARVA